MGLLQADAPVLGNAAFRKNFLINGCMRVSQRGKTFSPAGGSEMTLDRWRVSHDATAVTVSQDESATSPVYNSNIMRMLLTTKGGSFSDFAVINALESIDSYFLTGKTVTFSAYLRRNAAFNAGSFRMTIYSGTGVDEPFVTTGRVEAVLTIPYSDIPADNSWKLFSITAAIATDKRQVGCVFRLNDTATPDGSHIDIAKSQLEIGAVATPLEFRPFAEELALCQRYYQVGVTYINTVAGNFHCGTFPTPMRAAPIMKWLSATISGGESTTVFTAGTYYWTAENPLSVHCGGSFSADAEL
jgi:hypothetical protein